MNAPVCQVCYERFDIEDHCASKEDACEQILALRAKGPTHTCTFCHGLGGTPGGTCPVCDGVTECAGPEPEAVEYEDPAIAAADHAYDRMRDERLDEEMGR